VKRQTKRTIGVVGSAVVVTLMWPGPASGDTSLGGYSGVAQAQPIRVQIYEPTIPIPSTPQIDGSIGYTKSTTDTGPVSRATASYLWPGDVIGDGFGQLVGGTAAKYPVQANSRTPATADSPATNTIQLTDGNGMTTSSSDTSTKATVTGLGIAGPSTNLLGGLGKGLGQLGGTTTNAKPTPDLPVPVSKTLAGLATVQNVKSESEVVLGKNSVTTTAHAHISETKLLGGLITLGGFDVTSKSVSDGKKAVSSGAATIGSIKVAGINLGLDDKGLQIAGTTVKLPGIPAAATSLLEKLGISIEYLKTKRVVSGADGSFTAKGLILSIDTQPLKTALNLGGIVGPLADLIGKIPKLGSQVGPLLGLGPRIVFEIGDVMTSATAAPAYTGGGVPAGNTGGGTNTGGTGGATGGTGGTGGTGAGTGGTGGGTGTGTGNTPATGGAGGTTPTAIQPAGFNLPALGAIPRLMILGGLLFAVALGWVLRTAGGILLGNSRNCAYGLTTGVPDLRKA
jgi:hypothetical protein